MNDTLADRLSPLASRLAAIQDAKKRLADEEAALKAQILALVPGPDTYDTATGVAVRVVQAHRIDVKAVAAKWPAEQHPELYRQAVDLDAVKRHVAPADLEAVQTATAPSVVLA